MYSYAVCVQPKLLDYLMHANFLNVICNNIALFEARQPL